ncbi:MAG: ABC transporter permease [Reichenbachiella sp.]
MIKHFLRLTIRNLIKNKTYVIINILGMGLSLACCIVAYVNHDFAASFDRNHKNIDKIYKIHINKKVQDNMVPYGITPQALAPSLENESTSIQKMTRYNGGDLIMQKGDNVLNKYFAFTDDAYLDMFTYPLKYGNKESILEIGNVILSDKTAKLYFDVENPVGELIKLRNGDEEERSFVVSGVFEPIPENTSMQFDGMMNYKNYLTFYDVENVDWSKFIAGTFIYVDDASKLTELQRTMEKYVPIQNKARADWLIHDFEFIPLTELGVISRDVRATWMWNAPHPAAVIAPTIMALLMLLIACFNFTNTSIAISSKRLKEIGIRKVMGSNKKQLVIQFMSENIVLCLLSLILAVSIATWMVPAYGAMWEGMTLKFDLVEDINLILFLLLLLVFTAILAGAYPSFYISSFEPVGILKGNFQIGKSKKFTYSLLTAQFSFTIMALFASVVFAQNAIYQDTMEMGFDRESIVYTQVSESQEAIRLRNALQNNSMIKSVGVSNHHVGRWTYSRTLSQQEIEIESDMMAFGEGYINTMNMQIVKGRQFDVANKKIDEKYSILVNEKFVQDFGWADPIGQKVTMNDTVKLTVVGVLKDFYYNGFWEEISPMAIRSSSGNHLNFVVAKANVSDMKVVQELMKSEMLKIAPNKPYEGNYQEELLRESQTVNKNVVIMFSFLGMLALVLSAIGLFTLVSLSVQKRTKEIGIRKVLGASIFTIINLLNRNFLFMLIAASVLGTAAAYFAIDGLIASIFSYYKEIDVPTMLVPIVVIFIISLIVSASRIFQSAKRNPVESLRYE